MGSMVPYGSRKRLLSIGWTKRQGYLNQPLPQLHVIRYIDLLFSKGNKGIVLALFPFVNFFIISEIDGKALFSLRNPHKPSVTIHRNSMRLTIIFGNEQKFILIGAAH